MPTSVGPNTFGEENLVFGYDTGDTVNSYRGEPTTNLAPTSVEKTGGNEYLPYCSLLDIFNTYGPGSGVQFYVSFDAKAKVAGAQYMYTLDGSGRTYAFSGVGFSATTEFRRYELPISNVVLQDANGNGNNLSFYGTYGTGRVLTVKNLQIERKTHATPFVLGTRSATQGLIDLTGNSTIDLSNVSFDSNAQMTFDGSSDYVDLGSPSVLDLSTVTQEVVYQPLGINRRNPIIGDNNPTGSDSAHAMWLEHYTNNKLLLVFGDGSTYGDVFSTATITDTTKYYHIVCVRDASAKTVEYFINGVSDGVQDWANKSTIGTPIVYDGSFNNNNYNHYIGASLFSKSYSNIPYVKIYNRALKASEIKANYNAIKGRFNI